MKPEKFLQESVQSQSVQDPESFWDYHARQLHWHKPYSSVLRSQLKVLNNDISHRHWSWFPDGEISTAYNCVDRHVDAGHGEAIALIWESPVTGCKEKYTYTQLKDEIQVLASVLKDQGIGKGDVVLIYMPMIPAAVFAMLATVRLGAIHTVIFGGFAATSLAQRIDAAKPKLIMTASCAVEGTKGTLYYRPMVEGAIQRSTWEVSATIVWQRPMKVWEPLLDKQKDWQKLVARAKERQERAECVPIKSTDGLYIIYTSGTTGQPKGVLREAGGHIVGLNLSIKYMFDVKGPGDVLFTASDIGWIVGHSYIVYAPLLAGATTVLFEGKPIGTPDAGTFWRIIHEHNVTTLFTAPTALRAIQKEDPEHSFLKSMGKRGALKKLRAIFLAGERSEIGLVTNYQELLQSYGAPNAKVVDHWWSSETGSPITGLAQRPDLGKISRENKIEDDRSCESLPVQPGSAGKPMPGFDVRIVDDEGMEVQPGGMGNIVLALPLAPTGFTSLFNDDLRFYHSYLKRFGGKWLDTGDVGMVDEKGYIYVMSRSDDIINVAAHRLSTGAIEEAILTHKYVAEVAVFGVPDTLKGHLPFAFITPTISDTTLEAAVPKRLFQEINATIRSHIGGIASLGGIIQGRGMIPKTRSGKILRRCLRELMENGLAGNFDQEITIPATLEDKDMIDAARERVREYFKKGTEGQQLKAKL